MKVRIRMMEASQPIEIEAKNTYQKGDLFCVQTIGDLVRKFPLNKIFEIQEEYGYTTNENIKGV